jgi:hypothetical protein
MGRTRTPVNGRELVNAKFPYDGPHSYDTVFEAARAMDELAEYLGNATGPGNGERTLQYGPHVYHVIGALTGALGSLGQVLDQLAAAEKRVGADPTAYDDRRTTPAAEVADGVAKHLAAARSLLMQDPFSGDRDKPTVHSHLSAAHSASSRIGHNR